MSKKPSKQEIDKLLALADKLPPDIIKAIPHYLGLIKDHLDHEGNYQRRLLSMSAGGDFNPVVEILESINLENDLEAGIMIIEAHSLLFSIEQRLRQETEGPSATRPWDMLKLKYTNWLIRAMKVHLDQLRHYLEARRQSKLEEFLAQDYHYETEMLKNCLLCCVEKFGMNQELKDEIELIRPTFSKLFCEFEESTRG